MAITASWVGGLWGGVAESLSLLSDSRSTRASRGGCFNYCMIESSGSAVKSCYSAGSLYHCWHCGWCRNSVASWISSSRSLAWSAGGDCGCCAVKSQQGKSIARREYSPVSVEDVIWCIFLNCWSSWGRAIVDYWFIWSLSSYLHHWTLSLIIQDAA